MLMHNPK